MEPKGKLVVKNCEADEIEAETFSVESFNSYKIESSENNLTVSKGDNVMFTTSSEYVQDELFEINHVRGSEVKDISVEFDNEDWSFFVTGPPGYNESQDTYPVVLWISGYGTISGYNPESNKVSNGFYQASTGVPTAITSGRGKRHYRVDDDVRSAYQQFIWVFVKTNADYFDTDYGVGAVPNPKLPHVITCFMNKILPKLKADESKLFLAGQSIGANFILANIPSRCFSKFKKIVLFSGGIRIIQNSDVEYWFLSAKENNTPFYDSHIKYWYDRMFTDTSLQSTPLRMFRSSQDPVYDQSINTQLFAYVNGNDQDWKLIDTKDDDPSADQHDVGWMGPLDDLNKYDIDSNGVQLNWLEWLLQ